MQQNTFHFPFSILHLQGAVYPSEQDSTPIAELAARLLLKPNVTRVSCGRTTNNTYRIEWRDAYVSRTSNETIDASIELFRNGDVIVTESAYIDANPVNAGIVGWPDTYEWCSFAAACGGDEEARAGYDFIYVGKGRSWQELKDLHDVSIRQMLKEREWKDSEDLELARANRRPDRRGKCYAAGLETPGYVPPAYLRTTLGIASREYFTKAYLRPLTEAGLIARTDPDHPNSPRQKYALTKAGSERIRRVAPL